MTFVEDIKKPFNIVVLVIAIVSIVVAILFYKMSQKERKLAYFFPREPSLIFDSKKSGPSIQVLDQDSVIVKEDVFLHVVTIWNAGDLEIEPSHIRQPLRLNLLDCRKILDYGIVHQTHPDIIHADAIEEPKNSKEQSQSLQLLWKHLDPGMGFKTSIIYTGSKDCRIELSGNVVGVGRFVKGWEGIKEELGGAVLLLFVLFPAIAIAVVLVIFLKMGLSLLHMQIQTDESSQLVKMRYSWILIFVLGCVFGVWYVTKLYNLVFGTSQPPF